MKFVLMCLVCVCPLILAPMGVASPADDRCAPPAGLRAEISKTHPESKLVSLSDLTDYKRKLFQKDHGTHCPGLAKVNFYGDGKPTWAVVLITGENPHRKAELLVARQLGQSWEILSLQVTDGTPVVWREGPGKYEDLYEKKTIRAEKPVIVFCGLESWAVVYAWNGKEVEKVQLSD